ncbi:SAV_915 family protein [Actinophytocola sp.]|uniref:SAV_915 family protein n=1 Tax=Actinophytocola sp. TaxID=1872138 RepID=UPI003D6A6668
MRDSVMEETGRLRSLSRAALHQVDRLAHSGIERLYGLSLPRGGLEWSQTPRGEAVLWVYSSIQNLVESCGAGQPWVRLTMADLIDVDATAEVPLLVALDVWHPDGARYPDVDPREWEPLPRRERVADAPDTVWVPARSANPRDRRVEVELRTDSSGGRVLLVYSSIEALRAGCGPHQAAVEILLEDIAQVADDAGAGSVAWDLELAEELRHQTPRVDWTRDNRFR